MALISVCVDGSMWDRMLSCFCLLFKPEENKLCLACDNGPEVDESAALSQDRIELGNLIQVQIEGEVVQTFFFSELEIMIWF